MFLIGGKFNLAFQAYLIPAVLTISTMLYSATVPETNISWLEISVFIREERRKIK